MRRCLTPAQDRLYNRLMIGLCLPGMPGRAGIALRGAEKRTARALERTGYAHYGEATDTIVPSRWLIATATALHAAGTAGRHAAELIAQLRCGQSRRPSRPKDSSTN